MARDSRRRVVAVGVVFVALLIVAAAGAGSEPGPNVDLSMASGEFGASDAVLVKVTVPPRRSTRSCALVANGS